MSLLIAALSAVVLPGEARSATPHPREVVFLESVAESVGSAELPRKQRVIDADRLRGLAILVEHPAAQRAVALHQLAQRVVARREGAPDAAAQPLYVALEKGGNHADMGFTLIEEEAPIDHQTTAYVRLDPAARDAAYTLLHETGHVLLSVLSGGRGVPTAGIAAIPHTTAALTDRGTAFNEGFAIHLETLHAHLADDAETRAIYRHERMDFQSDEMRRAEYYRPVIDLRTYAQSVARYRAVRDNEFAFAPASRDPDYLRVQLDTSRDHAELLDCNQLLQSEGFYATFFFCVSAHGDGRPDAPLVEDRQERLMTVLAEVFADPAAEAADTPWLVSIVQHALAADPEFGGLLADVLLDLSKGSFVDARAQDLWRATFQAALTLDVTHFPPAGVADARRRWREAVRSDPQVLAQRLGPCLPCVVDGWNVRLVAFGQAAPVSFDLNTVQAALLPGIPAITEEDVTHWLAERSAAPFASVEDFRQRVAADRPFLSHLRFEG